MANSLLKSTLSNSGAVAVVENAGTFTDNTGTIVAVTGANTLSITLDKEYDKSVVVVKVGDDVIAAENGVYTIKNITKNIIISVTGIVKNVTTGIEDIVANGEIYGAKGEIVIELSNPTQVEVYSLSGIPVFNGQVSGTTRVQASAGIYAISLSEGGKQVTTKVIVR